MLVIFSAIKPIQIAMCTKTTKKLRFFSRARRRPTPAHAHRAASRAHPHKILHTQSAVVCHGESLRVEVVDHGAVGVVHRQAAARPVRAVRKSRVENDMDKPDDVSECRREYVHALD